VNEHEPSAAPSPATERGREGRDLRASAWTAARKAGALASRHWVFVLLACLGIGVRIVTLVGFSPVLPLRNNDAYQYLARSVTLSPEGSFHPFLYSATLKPFLLADALPLLALVQHLAALGMALLLYAVLVRFGLAHWVAALGVAPVLLDGYQIALEHQIFSETFFELSAVAGVALLVWNSAPRWPLVACAGVLTATSVLFRFAGLAVIAAGFVYVLVRRMGWRTCAVFVASAAVPLLLYATWFNTQTGTFGLTNRNGFYLYGRVAAFADCERVRVPAEERVFCPENLEHEPGRGLFASGLPDEIRRDPAYNGLAASFARRMILGEPTAYASAVASDFSTYFKTRASQDHEKWFFPRMLSARDERHVPPGVSIEFRLNETISKWLRAWQRVVSVHGPLLALLLLLGLVGSVLGWSTRNRPPIGPEALVFTLAALGLMLFPTIFAVYHFRYTIPVVPFAGAAGAAGAWALWEWFRGRRSTA
jgi:hypothetical protein